VNYFLRKFSIVFLVAVVLSSTSSAQKYETSFYGEESFRNPIQIPVEVSRKLKKDWDVKGCSGSDGQFSNSRFEATTVNLNDDKLPDLLIKAKDPNHCLNGNAISFWAFTNIERKFSPVFYAYALSLEVTKKRSKNYFDLWTGRCTASICFNRLFAFDGQEYVQTREWEESVRPGK
jgi:hypothetical protein